MSCSHSLDVDYARAYGIQEALILNHLLHWIRVNIKNKKNFKEGRTWTYQTLDHIASNFSYMTKEEVRGAIERLCTGKGRRSEKDVQEFEPVLIKGNFNKRGFDKTTWYAIRDEEAFNLKNLYEEGDLPYERNTLKLEQELKKSLREGDLPDREGDLPDREGDLPDQYQIHKTYIKEKDSKEQQQQPPFPPVDSPKPTGGSMPVAAVVAFENKTLSGDEIEVTKTNGQRQVISKSEIYRHFVSLPYKTETVAKAIEVMIHETGGVNNILKFLEAVCKSLEQKQRQPVKSKPQQKEEEGELCYPNIHRGHETLGTPEEREKRRKFNEENFLGHKKLKGKN